MIRQLKNLDMTFKHVRLFTAVLIPACMMFAGFCIYYCLKKVYVLANGKAILATVSSHRENIPVEASDHIRAFHESFFICPQ
ncbi:hypothetical protein SAMN04487894_101539 [Niabella drilacis]|uniref:Uncharacterized protein n=1 Tax=Niabella drilacis (strain DSM 25811 / CCM 8410 / CCUG 62505 / LMG 26954 / E90) TaxID=1285928 RepID=A0A1G6JHN7_NIADE|nr:hypothetical protein SAMN04487894_101539 [Niabella drilacis]